MVFVHAIYEVRLTITFCGEDYFIGIIDPNEISLLWLINYICQVVFNRNRHDDEQFNVQVKLPWNNEKILIESVVDIFLAWEKHKKFDLFDINIELLYYLSIHCHQLEEPYFLKIEWSGTLTITGFPTKNSLIMNQTPKQKMKTIMICCF